MSRKPVRVFLIRKNIALAAGALLAAAAIFGAVNVPAAITAATTARQLPIYCVDRPAEDGKKYCAISFDAAWAEGKLRRGSYQTYPPAQPHRIGHSETGGHSMQSSKAQVVVVRSFVGQQNVEELLLELVKAHVRAA